MSCLRILRILIVPFVLELFIQQAAPAFAEEALPAATSTPEKIEKIEVTGSHIKRIDVEGVAPVTTVTRKDIDKTGYDSVADVIRDTGANSFGSTREQSGYTNAGNAEVDLRGLGADNTLVLLNGQRLPTDAISGTVDLNLIPLAAVERIEILKDGASAVYGSDALGGVVNIITRKDFAGTEASITQSLPDKPGGDQTNVSLVNGVNAEKLNIVTVVTYRYNQAVNSRDRTWSDHGISKIGDPGSYRNDGGSWIADANCPPSLLKQTPDGTVCSFKYSDFSSEIPSTSQLSAMSEGTYELSPSVKLNARVGATHRSVKWSFAPSPGDFTIPGTVADHLGPAGGPLPGVTPGQDLEVQYRLAPLGTRDTVNTMNAWNLLLGSTIQLPQDWTLEVTATHNIINGTDVGVSGYALTDALNNAISTGAFNPFAPAGQQGSLDGTKYVPTETTYSRLTGMEIKASGDVAQSQAGPIGLAFGTYLTYQSYSDDFDAQSLAGNVFGNAGSTGAGHRNTEAVYAELSTPIVRRKLEVQLAGRFDHYSDFGATWNPKVGVLYHATPSVLLRASVGTGFRAPLMQELYAAQSVGYPPFIDQVACNKETAAGGATPSCKAQQYQVTNQGNPGLKQETSVAYNVGAIYEPTPEFNVSLDWFLTKIENVPGIDYHDMTVAEANGVNVASYGVTINRDNNGYINNVLAPLQNLSQREVTGLDVGVAYRFHPFKFATEQSQMFLYKDEGFPGAGLQNKLGWAKNPAWRNTTALTFNPTERHDLTLAALTTAEQLTLDQSGHIGRFTSLDLAYQYKSKSQGTFSAGVKNILATTPPIDLSNPTEPVNYALYDPNGRQFMLGYKRTF